VNYRARIEEAEALKTRIDRLLTQELRNDLTNAGLSLTLSSSSFTSFPIVEYGPPGVVTIDADQLAEEELLEETGSYQKKNTGIDNVIFLSPKGNARHPARIKVAIEPWDSFDPRRGKTASIAVHDGAVIGEFVPPDLYRQLLKFIDINRQTLLDYWEYRISTTTMEERLRPVEEER
jgi:NAD(P)H-dependent FMN reductase